MTCRYQGRGPTERTSSAPSKAFTLGTGRRNIKTTVRTPLSRRLAIDACHEWSALTNPQLVIHIPSPLTQDRRQATQKAAARETTERKRTGKERGNHTSTKRTRIMMSFMTIRMTAPGPQHKVRLSSTVSCDSNHARIGQGSRHPAQDDRYTHRGKSTRQYCKPQTPCTDIDELTS